MKGISSAALIIGSFVSILQAAEVELQVEKSTSITFRSENFHAYKLLAAEDPAGTWHTLQDGIAGTGGLITIFYKSESDQKLFFKIETSDGPPGQRSLLSLAGLDLSHKDLTGYDLQGADLRSFKFQGAVLDNANLAGANLGQTLFEEGSLKGADLRGAILDNTDFGLTKLNGANLSGMLLTTANSRFDYADLRGANLSGTRFDSVRLSHVNFSGNNLAGLSLRGSDLSGADLSSCNLTGADLSRTSLGGANLAGAVLTGVNLEGDLLAGVSMAGRDLRSAKLPGVHVGGGDWSGVNLAGTDLTLSYFEGSTFGPFGMLNLTGANFSNCNLTAALFDSSTMPGLDGTLQLSQVNFRNANLTGASFANCNVQNCDFTGANLAFADFTGASLAGSTGFDPEQPGMRFGPREGVFNPFPTQPLPLQQGTVLPDGSVRNGTNPGNALAPSLIQHLVLNIDDSGNKSTLDLVFNGNQFSLGVGAPTQGTFKYTPRTISATLQLIYNAGPLGSYTFRFTSPTDGKLYLNVNGVSESGVWPIGTFHIP